jgi:glycosyltransferase involved in cell wall biosynthesis
MSCRLVYFDVVVPVAAGGWDRLKRAQYARLIRKADRILTVHADTTEYERLLQLPAERFHYVGFKSNSWEDSASITSGRETADTGTYVLACGRSYRDFATFAEAMAEANLPARILMDQQDVRREGSIVPQTLPSNVEIIRDDGSRRSWLKAMLAARIVVAPLRAGVHQPAGISVYLEAMSLSRPVIVTEGTSTRGMLDDSLAGIVPPEDARALALEVRRLWDNHKLRHERIAAARKYVEGLGGIDRMSCAIVRATFDLLQTHAGALGSAPINAPVLDPS